MCYNKHMKTIQIYIYSFLILFCSSIVIIHASSEKNERAESPTHTQHPPHDHQEPDHIKKLDEGMRRKRKDEKTPTI